MKTRLDYAKSDAFREWLTALPSGPAGQAPSNHSVDMYKWAFTAGWAAALEETKREGGGA